MNVSDETTVMEAICRSRSLAARGELYSFVQSFGLGIC